VNPKFDYQFNFLPWFEENDKSLIGGTQLIPLKENFEIQDKEHYHVILENFEFNDF